MADNPFDQLTSNLDVARMDVIGLKLCIQALILYAVKKEPDERLKEEIRSIYDIITPAVDTIIFSHPETAEIWRQGVKNAVNDVFDPFLSVK